MLASGASGSSGAGGSGRDGPLGPDEPGGPNHEWFRRGRIDPRKFSEYLFVAGHPFNRGKAEGWRRVFGLGTGDEELAARLIREQLERAPIEERPGRRGYRRWELVIPDFEGPNGNVAPLLTAWALDPEEERSHMSTAYPELEDSRIE
jgi:hypothetical protein